MTNEHARSVSPTQRPRQRTEHVLLEARILPYFLPMPERCVEHPPLSVVAPPGHQQVGRRSSNADVVCGNAIHREKYVNGRAAAAREAVQLVGDRETRRE